MKHCIIRPSAINVQLFTNCDQLPAEWDSLLPADHFLQAKNLSISEVANFPDISFLYAITTLNKKPIALSYFQLLQFKENHLDSSKLSFAQSISWKGFAKLFSPKLLIAGHLFRHDVASFFYDNTCTPFDAYKCYKTTIDKALSRSGAHAVLLKDMPEELGTYFQNYAPEYLMLRNDISMQMEFPESCKMIHDYEKLLKHKYAQRFRKIRKEWTNIEVKELSTTDVFKHKQIIYDLYRKVNDHQFVRLGTLSDDFIPLLKQQYPDRFKVWMAYANDVPVAFFSAWLHDDIFDMFYIGFDYSKNEKLHLYFNILFFSVEQAIFHQKKKLILGRTALEAKARIGCKPKYLSTFLYIRNSLLRNLLLGLQQKLFKQEGEWENRHPFK